MRDNGRLGPTAHHLALLLNVALGLVEGVRLPGLLGVVVVLLAAVVVLVLSQLLATLPGVLLILEKMRVKNRTMFVALVMRSTELLFLLLYLLS